jgi:hypothetical protein
MTTMDPFVFITKKGHKQIRNKNGYVLMTYKNIPKSIKFKHIAVNDYNQHLCNGWFVYNHTEFEEIDRVEQGLKPVGISHSENLLAVTKKALALINKGFLVSYTKNPFIEGMYNITASVTGKLKDYFDMDKLASDYEQNGLNSKNIINYKDVNFSEFHYDKYDCECHPIEITGLILGYPIENTIALIKQ